MCCFYSCGALIASCRTSICILVGTVTDNDKTISHWLSKVIVVPDVKIYRCYPTNDWDPDQVVSEVKELAARGGD